MSQSAFNVINRLNKYKLCNKLKGERKQCNIGKI